MEEGRKEGNFPLFLPSSIFFFVIKRIFIPFFNKNKNKRKVEKIFFSSPIISVKKKKKKIWRKEGNFPLSLPSSIFFLIKRIYIPLFTKNKKKRKVEKKIFILQFLN